MDQKQALKETLEAGQAELLRVLAGVTEDLAACEPTGGGWSIRQCVEHVAIAEKYLLAQIAAASHSETPVLNEKREAAIRELGIDRTRRFESPQVAKPTGQFRTLSQAVEHFLGTRRETLRFLEDCKTDLRSMSALHPIMGRANCYEMILMMGVHPHRHAKQIGETRDRLQNNPAKGEVPET